MAAPPSADSSAASLGRGGTILGFMEVGRAGAAIPVVSVLPVAMVEVRGGRTGPCLVVLGGRVGGLSPTDSRGGSAGASSSSGSGAVGTDAKGFASSVSGIACDRGMAGHACFWGSSEGRAWTDSRLAAAGGVRLRWPSFLGGRGGRSSITAIGRVATLVDREVAAMAKGFGLCRETLLVRGGGTGFWTLPAPAPAREALSAKGLGDAVADAATSGTGVEFPESGAEEEEPVLYMVCVRRLGESRVGEGCFCSAGPRMLAGGVRCVGDDLDSPGSEEAEPEVRGSKLASLLLTLSVERRRWKSRSGEGGTADGRSGCACADSLVAPVAAADCGGGLSVGMLFLIFMSLSCVSSLLCMGFRSGGQ